MILAVVDYGMGNLASVAKACKRLGARVRVTDRPVEVAKAAGVIFPGVGAFGAAVRELRRRRLLEPIRQAILAEKPFLGLCLGLQLLMEESEESPGVRGLGVFPGRVRRFPKDPVLKVPHMGWNRIEAVGLAGGPKGRARPSNPLLWGVPSGAFMYFVHSYYADPEGGQGVAAETEYGLRFPSVLWDGGRVWATQFHPEKSQRWGLRILRNFLDACHSRN